MKKIGLYLSFLLFSGKVLLALAVGDKAPFFSLLDETGKAHVLQQYQGKIVVLEWVNPNCPYVKRHSVLGTMSQLSLKYQTQGVVWLAIQSTYQEHPEYMPIGDISQWKNMTNRNYPILQDSNGEVGKLYDAKTTPHMFIISTEGIILYQGAIDDDAAGSKTDKLNYIDKALTEVLNNQPVEISSTKPYGCSVKYK